MSLDPVALEVRAYTGPNGKVVRNPSENQYPAFLQTPFALQKTGTTAERPTATLLEGQEFFDTTLGQPVWWNGSVWVDYSGSPA